MEQVHVVIKAMMRTTHDQVYTRRCNIEKQWVQDTTLLRYVSLAEYGTV
jgi:hypothetical protein